MHKDTNIKFSANIYLTPKESEGFNFHYDTHDVIILQIHGKKRFCLYDKPIYLPTKLQAHNKNEEFLKIDYTTKKPIFDKVLESGDLLYIPRGLVHKAESKDTTSIHCTLGMFPQKWHNLFNILNERITSFKEFRNILPLHNDNFTTDDIVKHFEKITIKALRTNNFRNLVNKLIKFQRIENRLTANNNRLLNLEFLTNIKPTTILSKVEDVLYEIEVKQDIISINFYKKTISFPVFMEQSIIYIVSNNKFTVEEIQGDVDYNSKLIFSKKLIAEGFLTQINI